MDLSEALPIDALSQQTTVTENHQRQFILVALAT
jgi:hypothetical protein